MVKAAIDALKSLNRKKQMEFAPWRRLEPMRGGP